MNIFEKLLAIQGELKVPKSQFNAFGNYKYRNCEDILEAVKPHCLDKKAVLFLTDKVVYIEGRHYVEATATLVDCENDNCRISVTASAREEETKKGIDGSQITGASSSYARKYALNGLFDIDDTKDSDTTNHGDSGKKPEVPPQVPPQKPKSTPKKPTQEPIPQKSNYEQILELIEGTAVMPEYIVDYIKVHFGEGLKVNNLNAEQFNELYSAVKKIVRGE